MFINAGARLLCTSDGVCVIVNVQFSSVGAGMVGGVLLFILGSNLGGVGPDRGLRGEEEGGIVRSGQGAARTILLFQMMMMPFICSFRNKNEH